LISNLHAELDDQNSRYSLEVLNYWLKSDVIPDFRLKEVSYSTLKKNGYFKTELELEHNYIPGQVIKVRLEDSNGMAIETIRLKKSKDKYVVYTSRKVKSTMVNPGEKIYEMSKFNNRDGFNPVSFFPGSAKRLYDDKYLIAWLPTMSKEPSKPFTLGVNGAILKYLWSRTLFDFSITDNLDLNSYSLNFMSSDIFQYTDISFGLGKDEYGISSMNLNLSGRGTWGLFEPLTTSLIAQAYIEEDTILNSHTLDLNLEKVAGSLALNLGYSNEQAIGFFKKTKKVVSVQLSLPSRFSFGLRLFSGDLNIDSDENEEISKEALTERYGFYPYNLEESRIRVNDESITSTAAINALSSDIKVPLGLFTGGMGLIGNRLLGRIFHDQAVTANNLNYEASGIGIELPFGGDVVGGGTVVIANLTVLVGLRQKIADITSEEPYMVFSFTGRL
jgi:hypothetical protein